VKVFALIFLVALGFMPAPIAIAQRGGPASVFAEEAAPFEFATEVEALGTLAPNERVELTLNAADRVTAIYFDDGERVRKGKTLLSLAQREQVALVEAAEADVEEARRQLERVTRLAEQNAVSQSELDEARRAFNAADAQLRAVQSRQKDRVLVAPFDGVLGFRQVSVGSFVRPGDVVAVLIDDSEMNLDFLVPSIFLRVLQPGSEIRAVTDDFPGEMFEGTVAVLDNAIDPVTRSIRVRAVIPNEERLLRAGMFMQVTLRADPRTSLAIPEEAIEPVGPSSFVYVVDRSVEPPVANRREISVGTRREGMVEVLSGLEAGETVVTEGLIRVRDGAPVVIRDPSMLERDRSSTEVSAARTPPGATPSAN
jgi:membrane fusion protein, multidrug efflux system